MVKSPSWEANRFAASQEIPCISRNPKFHYRTHKRPLYFYIYKLSSYLAEDKVCLIYEEQSPKIIQGNNWCLWLDSCETHKRTVLSTRRF